MYKLSVILIYAFAVIIFVLLFYISAPYGKFLRKGWGKTIHAKWAWIIMEFPSPALMLYFFISTDHKEIPHYIFISLWLLHYIHRTFIYPFTQSGRERPYPVVLIVMAVVFNCFNGFVNGYGVFYLSHYGTSWLASWQFVTGISLFIAGFLINKTADEKLRKLRKDSPSEYVLPKGWLFNYISCPHYFGEIIEWAGWAVMTWSVAGLAFFVFSFANLFPRGFSSHKWYKVYFPDYPRERKAIIPFIV